MSFINAFAADVKDLKNEYKTLQVNVSKVNGVKLYFSKEFTRTDCNQINVYAEETFVGGNKDGNTLEVEEY